MEMVRTAVCKKSQKGNLYLASEKEGHKDLLISLVKDDKGYKPKLIEGNRYEITFTSYKFNQEKGVLTLFGVSNI